MMGQYWVLAYSLIALALLVIDWGMWFARPTTDQTAETVSLAA
jgi:hypothetical protein